MITKPTLTDVLDINPALARNQIVFDEALRVCAEDFRAHQGGLLADTRKNILLRILMALRHLRSTGSVLHTRHTAGKNHAA